MGVRMVAMMLKRVMTMVTLARMVNGDNVDDGSNGQVPQQPDDQF